MQKTFLSGTGIQMKDALATERQKSAMKLPKK